MNLIEAIKQRHSVRSYQSKPLPQDVISQLQEKIDELNAVSGLNMQLVVNEKRGAFIGGILLGIIEILGKAYISSQLSDAIVFAVLIIVLLVKPTGILGKPIHEKV